MTLQSCTEEGLPPSSKKPISLHSMFLLLQGLNLMAQAGWGYCRDAEGHLGTWGIVLQLVLLLWGESSRDHLRWSSLNIPSYSLLLPKSFFLFLCTVAQYSFHPSHAHLRSCSRLPYISITLLFLCASTCSWQRIPQKHPSSWKSLLLFCKGTLLKKWAVIHQTDAFE